MSTDKNVANAKPLTDAQIESKRVRDLLSGMDFSDVNVKAVNYGGGVMYCVLPKSEVKAVKAKCGELKSYSPKAFKLKDVPTPQADGSVKMAKVTIALRMMNSLAMADVNKDVDDDEV